MAGLEGFFGAGTHSFTTKQGPYGEAPRYPPGGQWQAQGAYSQQPAAGYPAIYQYAPPPTVRGRVHDAYPQRPHEGHPQRAHEAHPQRPTVSCPYCGHTGAVAITREVGLCNWASAVLMALLGFIPCCIIPFCCTRCPHKQSSLCSAFAPC